MDDKQIILEGFRNLRHSMDNIESENRASHQQVILELNEVKFRQGALEEKVIKMTERLEDPDHIKDMTRVRAWRETQDRVTGHALMVMIGSLILGGIAMIMVGIQFWFKDKFDL